MAASTRRLKRDPARSRARPQRPRRRQVTEPPPRKGQPPHLGAFRAQARQAADRSARLLAAPVLQVLHRDRLAPAGLRSRARQALARGPRPRRRRRASPEPAPRNRDRRVLRRRPPRVTLVRRRGRRTPHQALPLPHRALRPAHRAPARRAAALVSRPASRGERSKALTSRRSFYASFSLFLPLTFVDCDCASTQYL